MKEVEVNGKKRMCYIVKQGDVNDIVVTYDSLGRIDVKRFHKMESEGGELMRVMRDTTLDNGMNALKQYENLLRVVPTVKPEVALPITVEKSTLDVQVPKATVKKKRRGRPPKKSKP